MGNTNHAEVDVQKDIIAPAINIITPNVGKEFYYTPVYEIAINEGNLNDFWYTIDGGAHNFTITEKIGIINSDAWNAASYGPVILRFYARDLVGNIGTSFVIIMKTSEQQQPQLTIPGYEFLMILGVTFIMIFLIMIQKRFKS